ncbi:CheB methylesterase domain-containing protein, partial [Singulisphaera rosea]
PSAALIPSPTTPSLASRKDVRGRIVAIGASTGGPAALQQLITALPRDFSVPVLIVQHITPGFTEGLASWLNTSSGLNIRVAGHDEELLPHTVYIAPDDRHLGVSKKGTTLLSDAEPIAGFRPSATFLFDSVAASFGASTLAVILTGMGSDGLPGLRSVRQMGGHVIAQDEATCVIYGMPKSAIDAGVANQVLPIDLIAHRLTTLV